MPTVITVAPPTGNAQKDMAAIDAAIKAANAEYMKNPEAGQVTVKLAAGIYAVTGDPANASKGPVELLSGVALVGEGQGETVIKLVDGFNFRINGIVRTALTDVSDVSVSNLTIDGNRANNTGHQAGFICGAKPEEGKTQSDITLSGVEIKNCTAYGFNPHEVSTNVTIENCVAHGNGLDGFVADAVVGGTYRNNVSYDNDRHGFNIQNATTQLTLENNKAYSNGSAGLTIQRGDVPPEDGSPFVWVSDIQVIGGEYYGNTKEGILVKLSDDVMIDGVKVHSNLRQGIRIEGSTDTIVKGSFIYNNSQEADNTYDEINIRLRDDTSVTGKIYYSTGTQIFDNNIYSDGAVNSRWGVREEPTNDDGGATGTSVSGNTFHGSDAGAVSVPGQLNPVFGSANNDTLPGTTVGDEMHGLGGNDTYTINHSTDKIIEQAGEGTDDLAQSWINYTLNDNVEHLTLMGINAINGYGNALNNRLTGNAASNVLKSYGGDDTLIGGSGADSMEGGDGNDTYYVDNVGDIVDEKVNSGLGGIDTIYSSVNYSLSIKDQAGLDQSIAVEKLILTGSAIVAKGNKSSGNNLIGNALNNTLDGLAGEDLMEGRFGDDTYYVDDTGDLVIENANEGNADQILTTVNYTVSANVEHISAIGTGSVILTGNELNNRITGNAAANTLRGGAGHDTLNGSLGADSMEGGDGNDVYYVDNLNDLVVEKPNGGLGGYDTVYSSINYALGADVERVILSGSASRGTGNALSNTVVGNALNNVLNGAEGADRMSGGSGNDSYYVDDRGDVVIETSAAGGTDLIRTSVSYVLSAYVENMYAIGSSAIYLVGNNLNNTLVGNTANNTIKGSSGHDRLYGGAGNDLLYGGVGNDIFVFNTAPNSSLNKDKIMDFDARYDTIRLENAIFKSLKYTGTLSSSHFAIGSGAKDSNDFIGYNKSTGDVWYDYNGSAAGGRTVFANIGANETVTNADFYII
ncbi:right-handed parallel beta-helix repeat-containing protein [Microvirga vignae]|uniref:right-handed parallel beta-helix repeat-containing protein n=1 Tax=Microvirga vignae TaxID=1225564 RepID=UPI00069989B2|nr:right-handed parallel beta-helix repeat-containing protein [Microvirga vignae]